MLTNNISCYTIHNLFLTGSTRDCPGFDDLPSTIIIYGSFLLYGPVAFFSEHLAIFIGRMNKDKDWTEWKLNSMLFSWFLLKAAIFITMIVWVILDIANDCLIFMRSTRLVLTPFRHLIPSLTQTAASVIQQYTGWPFPP